MNMNGSSTSTHFKMHVPYAIQTRHMPHQNGHTLATTAEANATCMEQNIVLK